MKLAPHAFRQVSNTSPDVKITIVVPDLFDQLTTGKVSVRLSSILATISPESRAPEATMHGDEPVNIPLPLVVSAINPTELQKRTAKKEIDRGEKHLPNLFTPGSLKKPVAETAAPQPAAAAATPPAAAPKPTAPAQPKPPGVAKPPSPPAAPTPPISVTLPPSPVVTSSPPPAAKPAPTAPTPPAQTPPAVRPAPAVTLPAASAPPAARPPAPTAPAAPKQVPSSLQPSLFPSTQQTRQPEAAAPKPAEPAAPELSRVEREAQEARERKAAMEAEMEEAAARESGLVLYGIDINAATAEEMVARFNGVGRKLAEKIVANRAEMGPFRDIYDIARIPGVKGRVFQRITGMAWPAQLFRHREQVARIVGVTGDEIPDVRGVAQRFRELEGLAGCIMIDRDGLILASTWDHPASESLGAFAPQMFKKLSRYVKQLKLGDIKTLTFFTDDQPVTIVTSGAILFVAIHKAARFSKRQVEFIQALATELGRKLQR